MFRRRIVPAVLGALLAGILVTGAALAAGGSYRDDTPSPTWTYVYYANQWSSPPCHFDLTDAWFIPANATVTNVKLEWEFFPSYGFSGPHVTLSDEQGDGTYFSYSGQVKDYFNDRPVRQDWTSRFWVDYWSRPGYSLRMHPTLTIWYKY